MIQLSHVSKSFDTKKVLVDVNWEVPQGSIFGLVGSQRCGKEYHPATDQRCAFAG